MTEFEEEMHDEEPRDAGEGGDRFGVGARMAYLRMLMRRGDMGRRRGGRRGGGFQGQGQGRVLRLLSLHSPIAQKELAYLLGIRSQSLAEQIAKLEEAGLVERRPNPEDRRTSVVDLTEAGRETVERNAASEPEIDPFAVLGDDEQRQLAEFLDRVIAGMEDRLPEGPDPRMRRFKEMTFDGGGFRPDRGGFGPEFGDRSGGRFGGFGPDDRMHGRGHGHGRGGRF